MEYTIGIALAVAVITLMVLAGIGRDRSFYATMTIVVASYYVLFAVVGGSGHTIVVESLVAAAFATAAVVGFRTSLWIVVAALIGHGLMDSVHHEIIANPGVPAWWPGFCMAFDVVAGGLLAVLLLTRGPYSLQSRGADRRAG